MNIDTIVLNDNIIVKELYDDIPVNGVMTSYDSDSPFMFCKILGISEQAKINLNLDGDEILVIKRYGKEEYLSGLFFISWKDVRCSISSREYEKMINEGTSF